jgi:hypothetical protein
VSRRDVSHQLDTKQVISPAASVTDLNLRALYSMVSPASKRSRHLSDALTTKELGSISSRLRTPLSLDFDSEAATSLVKDKPWLVSPSTGKREADMLLKWLNQTLDKLSASD